MKKTVQTSTLLQKIMRISVVQLMLIVFFTGISLAFDGKAQDFLNKTINLKVEDTKLRAVLNAIEQQTEVQFVYSSKAIKADRRLSVNANGQRLSDVLQTVLSPLRISYRIVEGQIILNPVAEKTAPVFEKNEVYLTDGMGAVAPIDISVSGTVSDENGVALPGVSILLKKTSRGTTTDQNGNYKIDVPNAEAQLVFSFIGYLSQEITVGNRSQINMRLAVDTKLLSEVVVVGYGTQKQREVTGAVSSVTTKDIMQVAVTGLDQAMQGRMAGVQVTQNSGEPGGSVSVRIRGVGSLTSGSEPLYVVDGIPLSGGLNAINPNDIERIDVLKDAASAAIYGSRGTNGVVLVTTKRGKSGKLTVSFDAYTGVQRAAKKLNLLDGPEFARLANDNAKNAGLPTNPAWANPASVINTDWQSAILQTSPITSVNASVSGGSERSRTFFSAGYFKQGGIIIGSDYQRYTARLNSDYDLSKRFKVGVTINIAQDTKNSVPTDNGFSGILVNAMQLQPTSPIYTEKEGVIDDTFYGWNGYQFISKTAPINFYPSGLNNEVHTNLEYVKRPRTSLQLLAALFGEYEIIEGLKFRSTVNVTLGNSLSTLSQQRSPDLLTSVGQYRSLSAYNETMDRSTQWNWINTLSYSRAVGKHNFSIIAGTDALKGDYRYLSVNGVGNPSDQLSINATDLAGRVATGYPSNFSLVSYVGRATYDYASKYLLTLNFRRDGSSKFGPNFKYGNFPSASVGWIMSEEAFMKQLTFVDEFKIRGSYGIVGNQNIGDFLYLNTYSADGGNYQYTLGGNENSVPALYANNIGDPNIRWEKSVQKNIGIDASFLKNKFTVTADYYVKDLEDLLGNVPIPSYTGVFGGTVFRNGFSMRNQGFELSLGYNQRFGKLKFGANANFSTLDNKVTRLDGSDKSYVSRSISSVGGRDDNASSRSQVGERIANFWGYVSDGIFQTADEVSRGGMGGVQPGDRRFKDLNGDGKINSDDKMVLGNGLPRYIFGLNLTAQYASFDVNIFFTGQADVQIANMNKFHLNTMRFHNSTGIINGSKDLLDSWTGPGTSNTLPRNSYDAPISNRYFSSYYIENGAFVRLRNLQVGYTLSEGISKKLGIGRTRLYVSGQNLLTFTKYSGYDPEIGSGISNQSPLTTGVDYGRYPVARLFIGGLSVQF